MGLFSKKDKSGSSITSGHKSSSVADNTSLGQSSSSSLKSPTTPVNSKPAPTIPKIDLPRAPDPHVDPAGYLRSIGSVRERCAVVMQKAVQNQLEHFDVDMSKFDNTTKFVVSIIKRDYAPDYSSIPAHGRWQHFNVGGRDRIGNLLASWGTNVDSSERTRRLLDLFLVSVLLDAGAGNSWSYKSKENQRVYRRSEGLAIASLEMFKSGMFSSNNTQPYQVDADGLRNVTTDSMTRALQVSESNPISGLEGRTGLLTRLADALMNTQIFGADGRPGNMLDYLISHPRTVASSVPIVPFPVLWSVLVDGLAPIWPSSRTIIDGTSVGDAWPLKVLQSSLLPSSQPWEGIIPFHKLTQWLCYSLMQPMYKLMNMHFAGSDSMTGLPEYRNGGLFIDTGVLSLKERDSARGLEEFHQNAAREGKKSLEVTPMFRADDDVVVEWRAVTVGFLDKLLVEVNKALSLQGNERLTLPQMLEAGSWKGGREMAEISRPNTQCPPIAILSDGTVF
ncbi:hypothetical protein BJ878DRAFT_497140 [Calycina marina]|uniref:Uncharacterized protein n=1 Tax=Calycina marina TaxID=1763456 RepID=A0A9P7Z7N9_9HELO|nr:hypothetical protein BJ878DRAFT_497140 [Calycina marina]